ncbi:GNAT family N-acetyltransferase [Pseudophaeobacter sp.]|uniref:GNAT family N-acetyltransferase n=1 Tax=Pseudophaeobacter sp. TaxID=1971739 RepID=UPI003A986E9F
MTAVIEITQDFTACYALRHKVFVQEQGVPESEELDAHDASATHLLAWQNHAPIGTARIVFDGDLAKIGRVCVLPDLRGTGLGADLIRAALAIARDTPGIATVKLGAQIQVLGFYEKLGFSATGPVYDDAGIDHRDMVMELA